MNPPIDLQRFTEIHQQNLTNLQAKLSEGKTLTRQQLNQLFTTESGAETDFQTTLSILADELPATIAREINNRPTSEERGRSIHELRGLLALALQQQNLSEALKIRKELNKLQGLYKKPASNDLLDELKTAIEA